MSKRIVLTGGGTAGHVNPNIALIPGLLERGYEIFYIGSHEGIEKSLIEKTDVPYFSISTGKLRRYFDKKNVSDAFRVIKGVSDAKKVLKKIKPDIIFSKGGFVSVPVVLAAASNRIPVIIHESDVTPGLANRISFRFATKICASFPETLEYLPDSKVVLTGAPIRAELLQGNRAKGLSFCGFEDDKPVITVMGGSIGSVVINKAVRGALKKLTKDFNIVHLCGKDNLAPELDGTPGYAQFEYVGEELKDVLSATDLMVMRSGANALAEILALKKPNILIPLSSNASRGDQILNANSYKKAGYSVVLLQEDLTKESLIQTIKETYKNKETYVSAMEESNANNAVSKILELIDETAGA